jgi:ATP-dependent Zn protease
MARNVRTNANKERSLIEIKSEVIIIIIIIIIIYVFVDNNRDQNGGSYSIQRQYMSLRADVKKVWSL